MVPSLSSRTRVDGLHGIFRLNIAESSLESEPGDTVELPLCYRNITAHDRKLPSCYRKITVYYRFSLVTVQLPCFYR